MSNRLLFSINQMNREKSFALIFKFYFVSNKADPALSSFINITDPIVQILPEKYSYYRRLDQDINHATDCVICMTAIDFSQRPNDCMVLFESY